MDHPVLAAGGEKDVAALRPPTVEDDHHLAVVPLLGLIGSFVPDADGSAAVFALWDLAVEAAVLERVVLDVHGEMVRRRIGRDAFGDCP